MTVDPMQTDAVYRELRDTPGVMATTLRQAMLNSVFDTLVRTFLTYTFIISLLGGIIAFGVIYNTARISLAERGRDQASPPEAWQSLGDGYRVDANFILWQSGSALQVPASSVFTQDGQSAVFLVIGQMAHRQSVTVGASNGLMTQIIDGLAEGDRVVRHPGRELSDGDRVRER